VATDSLNSLSDVVTRSSFSSPQTVNLQSVFNIVQRNKFCYTMRKPEVTSLDYSRMKYHNDYVIPLNIYHLWMMLLFPEHTSLSLSSLLTLDFLTASFSLSRFETRSLYLHALKFKDTVTWLSPLLQPARWSLEYLNWNLRASHSPDVCRVQHIPYIMKHQNSI
jgi:hypothetical protein